MSSSFFPLYFNLKNKKILFVGAGKIAVRRIQSLLHAECNIMVVAPRCDEQISKLCDRGQLFYIEGNIAAGDKMNLLKEFDIVFACTDDKALNHAVFDFCKKEHIMVNNCNNKEECDFYFPGIVACEDTIIAVSSGGREPKKTKKLISQLKKWMQENGYEK